MRQSAAKFKDHFLFGSIIHIHTFSGIVSHCINLVWVDEVNTIQIYMDSIL